MSALDGCTLMVFDDPTEQAEVVAAVGQAGRTPYLHDALGQAGPIIKYYTKEQWYGRSDIRTWSDVIQATQGTWEQGITTVDRILLSLSEHVLAIPKTIKRTQVWSDADGDFDYDRYSDGQECFRSTRKRHTVGQQFVTLVVDIAGNHTVSAQNLFWRAASAVVITERLENADYGVEIISAMRARCGFTDRSDFAYATFVKRADQPIDIPSIVNVISPWWFRTVGFGSFALVNGKIPSGGLGYAAPITEAFIPHIVGDPVTQARSQRIEGVWDERGAIQLINRVLNQFSEEPVAI
jgi:hypothetical protein